MCFSSRSRLALTGLILLLLAGALPAQEALDLAQPAAPPTWQPPDLAALPTDWWQQFDNAADVPLEQRFEQLNGALRDAVSSRA